MLCQSPLYSILTATHIYILLKISFPSCLSQVIGYSPLCYTVGSCVYPLRMGGRYSFFLWRLPSPCNNKICMLFSCESIFVFQFLKSRLTLCNPKDCSTWLGQVAQLVKYLPANAGDTGSIPGLGISPRERNGNPLHYSCLENPLDRVTWWSNTTEHTGTNCCTPDSSSMISQSLLKFMSIDPCSRRCHPNNSSSVTPSPLALNLSQDQGLFQWVGTLHQVAKVLELQLLELQSFRWIFRVGFL